MQRVSGRLVDVMEEFVEAFGGQLKKHIQAHNAFDLIRELQASESTAEAKAEFGLPVRRSDGDGHALPAAFSRGIAIAGDALKDPTLCKAFTMTEENVCADLRSCFVRTERMWLITGRPAEFAASVRIADAAAGHDLLCACKSAPGCQRLHGRLCV